MGMAQSGNSTDGGNCVDNICQIAGAYKQISVFCQPIKNVLAWYNWCIW